MNTAHQPTAQKYPPTFYISSRTLPSHVGRQVRIIGRVASITPDGTRLQLESPDGGMISIQRNMVSIEVAFSIFTLLKGAGAITSKYICVTGRVQADLSVIESISEGFGDSFSTIRIMD